MPETNNKLKNNIMTTLKFNRYETLSSIENMFLSNIIDVVRNVEVPSASKLRNMLNGAHYQ